MKNTNASVRIKSQIDNDGEVTEMDMIADARYEIKNGKYYIIYAEEGLSEASGCTTTIKVEPDGKVWVKRTGALDTSMCYEEGESHSFVYNFDFGSMTMVSHTKKLRHSLTESGGELEMEYELEMGAAKSKNQMKITVNNCGGKK